MTRVMLDRPIKTRFTFPTIITRVYAKPWSYCITQNSTMHLLHRRWLRICTNGRPVPTNRVRDSSKEWENPPVKLYIPVAMVVVFVVVCFTVVAFYCCYLWDSFSYRDCTFSICFLNTYFADDLTRLTDGTDPYSLVPSEILMKISIRKVLLILDLRGCSHTTIITTQIGMLVDVFVIIKLLKLVIVIGNEAGKGKITINGASRSPLLNCLKYFCSCFYYIRGSAYDHQCWYIF